MSLDTAKVLLLERRQDALIREKAVYDYEKVFWGSVYGVGLVGLGWLSIKLGKMIMAVQPPQIKVVSEDPYSLTVEQYNDLYPWVDPDGGKYSSPPPQGGIGMVIIFYRSNPDVWEELKASFVDSGEVDLDGVPVVPVPVKALTLIDGVFGRFGPVIPVGVVGFNMLSEKIRVKRLRGELDG